MAGGKRAQGQDVSTVRYAYKQDEMRRERVGEREREGTLSDV